jgi:electron transfer flavoprotein-quinone oxidoreductase
MSDFDAIVVGAGPAGVSAAITMVNGGLSVALLERGPYPGAKNLMGGVLYTDILETILPDFRGLGAPLERHVAEKRWSILSPDTSTTVGFRSAKWDEVPNNHSYTVLRARFDKWYAAQAEKLGVELICGVVVDELLADDMGRVIGVRTRVAEGEDPAQGELHAPVVVLSEGANALLAEKEGLRTPLETRDMALSVKEVIKFDEEKILDRFGLEGDQGVAWEFLGDATKGLPGAGFIYTNRDTLSVGVVAYLDELDEAGLSPVELLNRFKDHPAVRPLLRGGELVEYGAHMIPETGFDRKPQVMKDGLLVVGDAAGLVSTSPKHEGSNFAMASGVMAGETVLEAREKGDYTTIGLSGYSRRLGESFVHAKMEQFRDWPKFLRDNPHMLASWPSALAAAGEAMLKVDNGIGGAKAPDLESQLLDIFNRKIGLLPFAMTAIQLRGALRAFGWGKTDKVVEYIARNW